MKGQDTQINHRTGNTHCTVFHDQPLVRDQQLLQWVDDPPQVSLILVVVILPLGIQHIMHGHQIVLERTQIQHV